MRPILGIVCLGFIALPGALAMVEKPVVETPPGEPSSKKISKQDALVLATQYVRDKHMDWGDPDDARGDEEHGYVVTFATPDHERRLLGPRALEVTRNGVVHPQMRE